MYNSPLHKCFLDLEMAGPACLGVHGTKFGKSRTGAQQRQKRSLEDGPTVQRKSRSLVSEMARLLLDCFLFAV